jgi:hypothetical protein
VNLTVRTLEASDAVALAVLAAYAAGVCGTSWAARRRRLWKL